MYTAGLYNDTCNYIKLGKQECSNEMMSWEEAKNYCKNKDSELLVEETSPCKRGPGGGGEWLGLTRRWMFKSQRKKTGQ